MKRFQIGLALIVGLAGCDAAEINRICEPSVERQFNIVYNAHFRGQFTLNNTCQDTAMVYRIEIPTDTVLPGSQRTYSFVSGDQYLVVLNCQDSTLTYTYFNECP